jgi:hypothetical protein
MALIMRLSTPSVLVSNSLSKPSLTTKLGKRRQDNASLFKLLIAFEAPLEIFQY